MTTNKQPMLVGEVLSEHFALGAPGCLVTPGNLNTPSPAGLVLVASGLGNGAVIDSASILACEASLTASRVLLFLSSATSAALVSAENTRVVALATIASSTVGQRTNIPLPPLSVPVPNLAGPAATTTGWPGETDKKNTGLYIGPQRFLYAGVDAAIVAPSTASRVILHLQGGYF